MNSRSLTPEILVAGGGMSGVCAALQAARNGCKVVLCQDRSVLGGNASSEIRMHIVGADAHGTRGVELETEARESGLIEEIRLRNCVENPQRSNPMLDLTLYDLCRSEPNLTLLLNTTVTGVEMSEGRITRVLAERQSTETRFVIEAQVFIDATGDGRLGAEAGAPFRVGREGREEFDEALAQPQKDHFKLGSSLLFQASKHDQPMPFRAPTWVRKISPDDLRLRLNLDEPHRRLNWDYGFWWLEWGGHLDTIGDNEMIRDEVIAILLGVWDHVKNSGRCPESANWALDWCGFLPGKRESRRFIGRTILTENDVMRAVPCKDAIAYGGWWIDTHPPLGVDAPDEPPCTQHHVPHLYPIPLRCCVSATVPNLMFAGRNISATHLAFASTRVMATCAAVGQGVGAAAIIALAEGIDPGVLCEKPEAIARVQQLLLRDDAFLIGVQNEDASDLARTARINASHGDPTPLLSGQTRSVHGPLGARPEVAHPGIHRWRSDSLPAEVDLTWEEAKNIREIRIIFDTGLHRELTLSMSGHVAAKQIWGRPQPETVKDYELEFCENGDWQPLLRVEDNFLRLRIHRLQKSISTNALRLRVLSTHGLVEARVCEIRVY